MSGIEHTKDSIKRKMKLMDYEDIQQKVNTSTQHEVTPTKQKKVKMTVYVDIEHWQMFNDLCLEEMKRSGKPEKSQLICDAIELLYKSRLSST